MTGNGVIARAPSGVRAAITSIAIFLALASVAVAEDSSAGDQRRHGGWVFEATPYFWLPETHGTITVRDRSADVDVKVDFGMAILELGTTYRLLEHDRFILEGLAGARHNYVYANVELDTDHGGGSRDTSENVARRAKTSRATGKMDWEPEPTIGSSFST